MDLFEELRKAQKEADEKVEALQLEIAKRKIQENNMEKKRTIGHHYELAFICRTGKEYYKNMDLDKLEQSELRMIQEQMGNALLDIKEKYRKDCWESRIEYFNTNYEK